MVKKGLVWLTALSWGVDLRDRVLSKNVISLYFSLKCDKLTGNQKEFACSVRYLVIVYLFDTFNSF